MTYSNPTASEEAFMEDMSANIKFVSDNLANLPQRDQTFASSLCDFYSTNNHLSSKQLYYMIKFWTYLNQQASEKSPSSSDAGTSSKSVVFTDPLVKLFAEAKKAGLKEPHFSYELPFGDPVKEGTTITKLNFYITTHHSKYPGTIYISDQDHNWLARITIDGEFQVSNKTEPGVKKLIIKLVQNPKPEFIANGKITCRCCFCGLSLENKVSRHFGYGPICASKYGLPWDEGAMLEDELAKSVDNL